MEQKEIDEHDAKCESTKHSIRGQLSPSPWDNEPNRLNWKHKGLECMIIRSAPFLSLCGYVGVKKGHPLFGVGYGEENPALKERLEQRLKEPSDLDKAGLGVLLALITDNVEARPDFVFKVHGGLTYSNKCDGVICHMDDQQGEETWWFGFDCAHCNDLTPKSAALFATNRGGLLAGHGTYRDINYVKSECENLADQLIALQ